MSNSKRKKPKVKEEPTSRFNFVVGLIAAIAFIAFIAFAVRQKNSRPPAPVTAATPATSPAQGKETAIPLPQMEFTATAVAATERISAKEAKRLIDGGGAVVIDVRNVDDYTAGHIPGSLQIPLGYVQGEIPWFPENKKLITYCA